MDRTPYTDRAEIRDCRSFATSGGAWYRFKDPFDPSFRAALAKDLASSRRELDDPWCFGLFVDNELPWGRGGDIARWALVAGDGSLACRYVKKRLAKAAPHMLYLGCRFDCTAPDFVLRAAARHCDVVSFNIYGRDLSDRLDVVAFAKSLLPHPEEHEIVAVKYFTARVNYNPQEPTAQVRQSVYLEGLAAFLPELKIVEGYSNGSGLVSRLQRNPASLATRLNRLRCGKPRRSVRTSTLRQRFS